MKTSRCAKCGKPKIRTDFYKDFCLDGYRPVPNLCGGCNATESVVRRLNAGGEISIVDCRKLPRTLVFDPKGNNIQEAYRGRQFQEIIDKFANENAG